jgi:hypothetical protein
LNTVAALLEIVFVPAPPQVLALTSAITPLNIKRCTLIEPNVKKIKFH